MPTTTSKRADWLVPAGLIVLTLVPAVGGVVRMAELTTGGPVTPENARFFQAPLPVLLHILSGIVFGLLGALQFSPALRRRDFAAHGAWMTRAYAIGLGAGTQVLTHLPWFLLMDARPGELARGVMMGSAWVINLAVAEWILGRRPGLRGVTRSAATRGEVLAHAA